MPKRSDISSVLVIGSGPIVIGQACEFDYSGTQAIKALKSDNCRVVLLNSNPATIMTDPEFADATYIEPLTVEVLEKIIIKERPDAILPTVGGQTALNLVLDAEAAGVLKRHDVKLIGANVDSIKKAEDRELFKKAMANIGLSTPLSYYVNSYEGALEAISSVGYPVIIRPSFTLGGTGGNIAYNIDEYKKYVEWGLEASPVGEILVEESILGWKEYELEVMRDLNDNVVIVCSIENLDPMGIHTGDSITVAPVQTLTDKEYQIMRNAAIDIMREIGVETGGSNVQFAVNPANGKLVVIEMNPRVSRSSALASKATGFPIAKIAAKLAIGYTLDEIPNDITKKTLASFEPTIDYVVVKFPRFTFEKFPGTDDRLTTQMKSVGEAMAIGRTFKEAMQKSISSLELGKSGFDSLYPDDVNWDDVKDEIVHNLKRASDTRIWYLADAYRAGFSVEDVYKYTWIDPFFLDNLKEIVDFEFELKDSFVSLDKIDRETFLKAKKLGFSDLRMSKLFCVDEDELRRRRYELDIHPVYKRVDTCGAEFESYTPYLYSTYEEECEALPSSNKKVVILGGGPNRIGQGIEFDYCCVHASMALREQGYETIMVNCNPETVSTDYDTSNVLYFEPLTKEHVLEIVRKENPHGVIVQYGGQTPLKLALPLERENVPILGTSPDSIDMAEDRERFQQLVNKLGLLQPANGTATNFEEACAIADEISYPVVVRPSYVLGGRAMEIVFDKSSLNNYMKHAVEASSEHPVLLDKFLERSTEVDVDAICDGEDVVIGSIMHHIEEAGIHSGDSACSIPARDIPLDIQDTIRKQTVELAKELQVKGLMNIQYAVKDGLVYLLEVNPRASRTAPYVSKALGISLAKLGSRVMLGETLKELNFTEEKTIDYYCVKESVFPFVKFVHTDPILGPEMKSTGEVMGIGSNFGKAFCKAQIAAGNKLPKEGTVFISVYDEAKDAIVDVARRLFELGFKIVATGGTADVLNQNGISAEKVLKVSEGRPNIVDSIKNGFIHFVVNIPEGKSSRLDSESIRRTLLNYGIPYVTTLEAATASINGIYEIIHSEIEVQSIQDYYKQ